jgi:hypothetical protein
MMNELTGQGTFDSKAGYQDGHQALVSHRIYNTSNYGLQIVSPRYPSIDQIRDTSVSEQAGGPGMAVV